MLDDFFFHFFKIGAKLKENGDQNQFLALHLFCVLIFNALKIFTFYYRSTAELSNHHAIEEQKPSPTELTTVVCSARFLSLIVLYIPAW